MVGFANSIEASLISLITEAKQLYSHLRLDRLEHDESHGAEITEDLKTAHRIFTTITTKQQEKLRLTLEESNWLKKFREEQERILEKQRKLEDLTSEERTWILEDPANIILANFYNKHSKAIEAITDQNTPSKKSLEDKFTPPVVKIDDLAFSAAGLPPTPDSKHHDRSPSVSSVTSSFTDSPPSSVKSLLPPLVIEYIETPEGTVTNDDHETHETNPHYVENAHYNSVPPFSDQKTSEAPTAPSQNFDEANDSQPGSPKLNLSRQSSAPAAVANQPVSQPEAEIKNQALIIDDKTLAAVERSYLRRFRGYFYCIFSSKESKLCRTAMQEKAIVEKLMHAYQCKREYITPEMINEERYAIAQAYLAVASNASRAFAKALNAHEIKCDPNYKADFYKRRKVEISDKKQTEKEEQRQRVEKLEPGFHEDLKQRQAHFRKLSDAGAIILPSQHL